MSLSKITAIDTQSGKWKLILFTTFFAFVFTNIFQPFGIYTGNIEQNITVFIEIIIALTSLLGTLIFSQFLLRRLFNLTEFSYLNLTVWFLFESVLIATLWAVLSVLIDGLITGFISIWVECWVECVILIAPPYFAAIFLLNYKEKKESIDQLRNEINKNKINPNQIIAFKDTSGKEKISISLKDLLAIESNDNYVTIYYRFDNSIEKYLLRNTIKNLEEELKQLKVIRCHRSYMVNPSNIIKKEKNQKGLSLFLKDLEGKTIPVSKTYFSEVEKIVL